MKNIFSNLSYKLCPEGGIVSSEVLDDVVIWWVTYVFTLWAYCSCVNSLWLLVNKLGKPFCCKTMNFSVNAFISLCISWHFLSRFFTKFFIVSTFLTVKMVFVLSLIFRAASCSLVWVFKKWTSLFACSGLFANYVLAFWISTWDIYINSILSWIFELISIDQWWTGQF